MTLRDLITRPTALVPIVMSLFALGILILALVLGVGRSTDGDEGAAARIWQLLLIGQMPIVAFFAIFWVPRETKLAITVLAIQFLAALSSLAPVFLLNL